MNSLIHLNRGVSDLKYCNEPLAFLESAVSTLKQASCHFLHASRLETKAAYFALLCPNCCYLVARLSPTLL